MFQYQHYASGQTTKDSKFTRGTRNSNLIAVTAAQNHGAAGLLPIIS